MSQDVNAHAHHIVYCGTCGTVLSQCRCMTPGKVRVYHKGPCDNCKDWPAQEKLRQRMEATPQQVVRVDEGTSSGDGASGDEAREGLVDQPGTFGAGFYTSDELSEKIETLQGTLMGVSRDLFRMKVDRVLFEAFPQVGFRYSTYWKDDGYRIKVFAYLPLEEEPREFTFAFYIDHDGHTMNFDGMVNRMSREIYP